MEPPEPSPPRGRRAHILGVAYRLFRREGFRATGIDRIIAEAGVAKMTMYRHFPAKDELIVAVLAGRADRFERRLDGALAGAHGVGGRIDAVLDLYARWFDSPDFHGCLFAHALAEFPDPAHPVHAAAAAQKTALRARLAGILAAEHPPARAERLATTVVLLIEGATLLAETGMGAAAIAAARAAVPDLLAAAQAQP
ncbi:TetR/AcrR family transcriptional regulator [Ancylobacter terrae]|uniref:TetR/AcrR family transcriptional regulator n=1 Tax=Ancylobacter sp. sgz301288 TaxID=3342077 RepID=UPI00385A2F68